jgi:hypothetical protein
VCRSQLSNTFYCTEHGLGVSPFDFLTIRCGLLTTTAKALYEPGSSILYENGHGVAYAPALGMFTSLHISRFTAAFWLRRFLTTTLSHRLIATPIGRFTVVDFYS